MSIPITISATPTSNTSGSSTSIMALSLLNGTATMSKVILDPKAMTIIGSNTNLSNGVETIPFYIEMVDSDLNTVGIQVPTQDVIMSMQLTPTPNTMSINSGKVINRVNTMTRWVEEHWGDEITNVSFSGSSYSFILQNFGLDTENRNQSKGYQFMQEMIRIFEYNGLLYQDERTYEGTDLISSDTNLLYNANSNAYDSAANLFYKDPLNAYFRNRHPRRGMIKERLYINLVFDYLSLTGRFESFDIIEDAKVPYRFTYNVNFKAERTRYLQGSAATESG